MKTWIKQHISKKTYYTISHVYHVAGELFWRFVHLFFWLRPLEDKVVFSTFEGKRYGDNSQFILEELHRISPQTTIVWIKEKESDYQVPDYVKVVNRYPLYSRLKEYSTAKVWVDTHYISQYQFRRNGQLFIETWHGGLGIKKVGNASAKFMNSGSQLDVAVHNTQQANLFVSNSNHLTDVFRNAFSYKGKVWLCGYPKNDVLINGVPEAAADIRKSFGIPNDAKILLYAPTFRENECNYEEAINLDYERLRQTLDSSWGGQWYILVRMHPFLEKMKLSVKFNEFILNATHYPDMQKLILASDALISDYSSCIFDAALFGIPCITYATDFEEYKKLRGVYYDLEELPFPYARNNNELEEIVRSFNSQKYKRDWTSFKERTGLHETGKSANAIASVIKEFLESGDTNSIAPEDIR